MQQELIEKTKKLFQEHVKTDNLKMHCIEVEAIMREVAKAEGEDEEKWAAAGLLHDLDFENFDANNLAEHGKKTAEILKKESYDEEIIHTILSHNEENTGVKRESKLDYLLSAADNISGLIYAYALMRKSLEEMEVKGLKKKMKDKTFAAAIRRDLINDVEKFIHLDKFLEVAIKAMQNIKEKIGF